MRESHAGPAPNSSKSADAAAGANPIERMGTKRPSIAIIGAALGGLTVAATLRLVGFDVRVPAWLYGYDAWNVPLTAQTSGGQESGVRGQLVTWYRT